MKIAISAETTCDLSKELIAENNINLIPFAITLGDKTFNDGEVTTKEMFDFVDKTGTLPKTTALNEYEYAEYFNSLLKENDAVIHICLSSGLSSSCGNAIRAASNLENVYVVDSQNLSTGIGLSVLYACKLVKAGLTASEIAKMVQDRVNKIQASFVVERLDYLYKGGRCSSLAMFGANVFKIRPRIVVKDGKMTSDKKFRGNMGSVIEKYGASLMEEFPLLMEGLFL